MLQKRKPRELSNLYGYPSLNNVEIWSLILRSGTRKQSVFSLAKQIVPIITTALRKELSAHKLSSLLATHLPVGSARYHVIMGVYELLLRQKSDHSMALNCSTPELIATYFSKLRKRKQEHIYGVYLTPRLNLVHTELLAKGSTDAVALDIPDALYFAIKHRTRHFVLIHNHPSGDSTPSPEDISQTQRVKVASELLSLQFVDHIIIGKDSYFSFKESSSVL